MNKAAIAVANQQAKRVNAHQDVKTFFNILYKLRVFRVSDYHNTYEHLGEYHDFPNEPYLDFISGLVYKITRRHF